VTLPLSVPHVLLVSKLTRPRVHVSSSLALFPIAILVLIIQLPSASLATRASVWKVLGHLVCLFVGITLSILHRFVMMAMLFLGMAVHQLALSKLASAVTIRLSMLQVHILHVFTQLLFPLVWSGSENSKAITPLSSSSNLTRP